VFFLWCMGKPIQILRGVALLLCGLSVVLAWVQPLNPPHGDPIPNALSVLLPWHLSAQGSAWVEVLVPILIAGMFWRSTVPAELESPSGLAVFLLAVQTLLALVVAEELQFVVAVEAGLLLSTRAGALWVFGQAMGSWLLSVWHPELMSWIVPATSGKSERLKAIGILMLIAMLYNFLSYSLGLLAALEGRQRRALAVSFAELSAVNLQLREAQRGVAEAARLGERLRLARELHDAIGHQLSALSINLQIATRLSQDQARRAVLESYQLVGLLLADVRGVVSASRDFEIADLASALQLLASRVPRPTIHLNLDAASAALGGSMGHVLFRSAQEIITNAVRHATARNLWIEISRTSQAFLMTAWDDGVGNPELLVGNGLRGLEERASELGGSCRFANRAGAGFEVEVRLPVQTRITA
jgi:signal transduction histidine kinase